MRTIQLRSLRLTALVAVAMGLLVFSTGCGDDDDEGPDVAPEITLDGFYLQGDATSFGTDFPLASQLRTARVEGFNGLYNDGTISEGDRAGLAQGYVALTSSTNGFNIVQVDGTDRITWGLAAPFEILDPALAEDYPDGYVGVGDLTTTDPLPFVVPADGLYQMTIDASTGKVMVVDVTSMAIIGGGVGGWSDQEVVAADFDASGMTWVFDGSDDTGIESILANGQYKFRVPGGWKALLADEEVTASNGDVAPQLLINTNFGCNGADGSCTSLSNIIEGGGNVELASSAFNRYTLSWSPGAGFTGEITEITAIEAPDFSAVSMSLIGNAVTIDGGDGSWDNDFNSVLPTVDGNVYTYEMGGATIRGGADYGFKIRTTGSWDTNFGFPEMDEITGTAADLMVNNGGNLGIEIGGDFPVSSMTFVFNSESGASSLNVEY